MSEIGYFFNQMKLIAGVAWYDLIDCPPGSNGADFGLYDPFTSALRPAGQVLQQLAKSEA
jgi:hypothetical protein